MDLIITEIVEGEVCDWVPRPGHIDLLNLSDDVVDLSNVEVRYYNDVG